MGWETEQNQTSVLLQLQNPTILWFFLMEDSMDLLKENTSQRERGHREPRTVLPTQVLDLVSASLHVLLCGEAHVFQVGTNWDGPQHCSLLPVNTAEWGGQDSFCLACFVDSSSTFKLQLHYAELFSWAMMSELIGFTCPFHHWAILSAANRVLQWPCGHKNSWN